jgi:hypothetical protein
MTIQLSPDEKEVLEVLVAHYETDGGWKKSSDVRSLMKREVTETRFNSILTMLKGLDFIDRSTTEVGSRRNVQYFDHERVEYVVLPKIGLLRANSEGVQHVRSLLPKTSDPPDSPKENQTECAAPLIDDSIDRPLSDRGKKALIAMLNFKAIACDNLRSTADIAYAAMGVDADPNSLKNVMAELKILGLVLSRTGRAGGCWLTEKGQLRAKKLKGE